MGAVLLTALKVILPQPTPYSKDSVEEFVQRARRGPIIHRGGDPENTLAAIRHSKREDAVGVELDIMLTSDGHCVVLHDETVDRTSNGSGEVRNMTLEELQQLRFFGRNKSHSAGEQISTLEEAVSLCDELDLIVFLDVKPFKTEKDLRKLLHIFKGRQHLYNRVCIISYYISALYKDDQLPTLTECIHMEHVPKYIGNDLPIKSKEIEENPLLNHFPCLGSMLELEHFEENLKCPPSTAIIGNKKGMWS